MIKVTKTKFNFIFSKRLCLRSCLRLVNDYVNRVSVVKNYADTTKTMRTLLENFEGFSQILWKQSGEKKYLDVFTYPIAIT